MAGNEETTTTNTTTAKQETTAQQYENGSLPNPDPVHAAATTDLSASGSIASPAVEEPANSPTTNDVEQTAEDRMASARQDAMNNHAAAQGQDRADQSSRTEEEVA